MIYPGTHAVTGHVRTIAECDHPGCERSEYMAEEMGVYTAGETLRRLGWGIGQHARGTTPAHCPEHAGPAEKCAHPLIVVLDQTRHCGKCGRRVEAA